MEGPACGEAKNQAAGGRGADGQVEGGGGGKW